MGKGPRRINPVSVLVVLAIAAAIYVAVKFIPVYLKNSKVDTILDEARHEASQLDPFAEDRFTGTTKADDLADRVRDEILALGDIPEEACEVYFSDDLRTLHADYTVVVRHPFGKTTELDFQRSISTDRDE
jgi:hypothetical protein